MNCNKTETFFAEWRRMCDEVDFLGTCLLSQKGIVVGCTHCEEHVRRNIDKAIEIVQEWSDNHPVNARLNVLREAFPMYQMCIGSDVPAFCAKFIFGENIECDKQCVKCWNTPVEEL